LHGFQHMLVPPALGTAPRAGGAAGLEPAGLTVACLVETDRLAILAASVAIGEHLAGRAAKLLPGGSKTKSCLPERPAALVLEVTG
jgi:hypothetical protein